MWHTGWNTEKIHFRRHWRKSRCNERLMRTRCHPAWSWRQDWRYLNFFICIVSNFAHKLTLCWQVIQFNICVKCDRTVRIVYSRLSTEAQLKWPMVGCSRQAPGSNPTAACLRFVMDKVAMSRDFPLPLVIPPKFCVHPSPEISTIAPF